MVVSGTLLVSCSKGEAALEMPTVELSGYAKGSSVDFNDATLNQISEGGGEMGYKFGLAATLYPTYRYSTAARDAMAKALFGSTYKIGDNVSATTYNKLTAGDKLAVDGAIFATALTAQEQGAVATVISGFFDRVNTDMAAAKAPAETSAYAILKNGAGQAAGDAWVADVATGKNYADRFFVHLVKQYVETYLPGEAEDMMKASPAISGWALGLVIEDGIRRAIAEVGADNIDGAALQKALAAIDMDVEGYGNPWKVTSNNNCIAWAQRAFQWKVDEDNWEPISDWYFPISRPTN